MKDYNTSDADRITKYLFFTTLAILIASVGLSIFGGCTKYIPVETVRHNTDTVVHLQTKEIHDTLFSETYVNVFNRDSIVPILDSLNRVIGYEKWHYRVLDKSSSKERVKLLQQIDSLRKVKNDSIVVTKERTVIKTKEIEKKLSWLQKWLMYIGGASIIYICVILYRKIRKLM